MTVYVIERGTQHEGGSVQRVYADGLKAIDAARAIAKEDCCVETWTIEEQPTSPERGEILVLYYGCDYVTVRRWTVTQ